MNVVACVKVDQKSTDSKKVFAAVRRAMMLANWEKYVKGDNLVLKVNVVWDKIYPSCTTTPMVIEGVIRVIKSSKKVKPKKITIADTDTAAIVRADVSFKIQGIEEMAKNYGVDVVNLSRTEFKEVYFKKAQVLHKMKISKVLLDADTIITMPVLKTHSYSGMSGALKNQWGCIHDLRHNHHMVLNQAIADVNNYFGKKISFAIMDCLFGMEGQGPKTGTPRKVGFVLAAADKVAMDTAASRMMGLAEISHILNAEKVGIGSTKVNIVGNKLPNLHFLPAKKSNLVMAWEMRLRRLGPKFEKLLFAAHSPFLLIFRWTAKAYYDVWYKLVGIKNVKKMMNTNYGRMWRSYILK